MNVKKFIAPSLIVAASAAAAFSGTYFAAAVNSTNISRAIELNRNRLNYTEVNAATNVADPGGVCNGLAKRLVIETMPAGGEINSIVTKTRNPFQGPGIDDIGIIAVRAEQGGVQLSNGDIATPDTDLTDTSRIENRTANTGEIAFYDENDPWDVAVYICARNASGDPIDFRGLTKGNVDFYISETK